VTVTGYDLKKGIFTNIAADVEEAGSVVIEARFLNEMLRRLPDGIVSFDCAEDCKVSVRCGRSKYDIIGIESAEYPEIQKVEGLNRVSLPQKILKSMINETIFAIAETDVRPVYTGTLFEIEDGKLTLVSVDGYRLAKRTEIPEEAAMENCTFIVPGSALADIERICADTSDEVEISVGDKHIEFKIGDTVVITRRLEGDFLNYKKAIPATFKYEIKISRSEFLSTVDRVSLIVDEKNKTPVRVIFGDGMISCNCVTPLGKAEDVCICEGSGEDLLIGFNDRYLKDALKAAEGEDIKLCVNTASSPCVIVPAEGEEKFTYMVLPVRLHA
jgi:DNA polymerase-3 subunit beta